MDKTRLTASALRQYLRDANSYDSTLNNNEMMELYQALELSKSSASQDEQYNKTMEETENNCKMLEDLRKHSVPVEDETFDVEENLPDDFNSNDDIDVELRQSEENSKEVTPPKTSSSTVVLADSTRSMTPHLNTDRYDFNKMDICNPLPTTHKPLNKIEVKPIYKPPVYCRPEVLALDYCERERVIGEFHSKLLSDLNYYQRLSMYYAPSGKPVQSNSNFNGSLDRRILKPDDEWPAGISDVESDLENDLKVYTSRSGRQMKLKVYTEEKRNILSNKSESNISSTTSTTSDFPIKKRLNANSLKNDEIMKRSRIFRDSASTSLANRLFDELLEEEPKKIQKEKEMQAFIDSLNPNSDEESATNADSENPSLRSQLASPLLKNSNTQKPTNSKWGKNIIDDESDSEIDHKMNAYPVNKSIKRKKLTDDSDIDKISESSLASNTPLRKRPNLRTLKDVSPIRQTGTSAHRSFEEEATQFEMELGMEPLINSTNSESTSGINLKKTGLRNGRNTVKNKKAVEHSKPASGTSSHSKKQVTSRSSENESIQTEEQQMEVLISSSHENEDYEDIVESDESIEFVSIKEPFQRRRIEPPKMRVARSKTTTKGEKKGKNHNKHPCPICNKYFDQEELEFHASACNDHVPSTVITRRKANPAQKITCEICDAVFLLTTKYEVHVRECLEKQKRKK